MGELEKLKKLILNSTSIREIPISDGSMSELEILSANYCRKLTKLPDSIGSLINLGTLSLDSCSSLTKIPESISKLGELSKLHLSYLHRMEVPGSIGNLRNLEELCISCRYVLKIGDLSHLKKLRKLELSGWISGVKGIGQLTSLEELFISSKSLETIGDLSHLKKLRELKLIREMLSSVEAKASLFLDKKGYIATYWILLTE